MEQLSGLDTAFVHQDSHRTPMHICAVLIYDAGDDGQGMTTRADLKKLAAQRLTHFPLFRRKLKQVPMGMDTPYWIDIAEPDWEQHISESPLRGGGDWEALRRQLAQLHGARMNLAQPLWEMHLIQGLHELPGLPQHCQALVLKIHHAAIDGISMAAIINALHTSPPDEMWDGNKLMKPPGHMELWARAQFNSMSRQFKLAETVRNLLPGFVRARQTRQQFSGLPPIRSTGAHFNAPVRSGRSIGTVLMPMADVLTIKRAVRRVTLNDVAMACVSGALREYLLAQRKLPAKSLAAGVPINLRTAADECASGNKIATMIVGLATDIDDPVERLRMVHQYAVAGKKQINALGSGTVMDISDSLTPGVLAEGMKSIARARRVMDMPVPFHTMISNVPGPANALFLDKAELVVPLGFGPVRDNMGLFHIVSSSATRMSLSFSACVKLLPDAAHYEQCLQNAFEKLLECARNEI
jgi:diacylglycerol O-acyltransferase